MEPKQAKQENVSDDEKDDPIRDAFLKSVNVENTLNRGDELPFGYHNPSYPDGELTWFCGFDAEKRITCVFQAKQKDGTKHRECYYLKDMSEALHYRQELITNGWRKIIPPKIEFTMSDGKPMNRQHKRALTKKLKQDPQFLDKLFNNKDTF
jgi:hypothetical protein